VALKALWVTSWKNYHLSVYLARRSHAEFQLLLLSGE